MPHACVAIGLRYPVVDGLRGRLELLFQFLRPTSSLHQLDHLRPKFRRVRGTMLAHNRHLLLQRIDVRFSGSTSLAARSIERQHAFSSILKLWTTRCATG